MEKETTRFSKVKNLIKSHPRITYAVTVLCVAVVVGLVVRYWGQGQPVYSSQVTEFNLKDVGKLVTQEGCYTSIQTLADSRELLGVPIPLTGKKYVYSMDGVVSAGINFEEIEIIPDESSKTLTVFLPPAEIFRVTPNEDSFTIYHDGDNPFNGLHLDETNESRKVMIDEIREKALNYGILDHALENAKTLLTVLIGQAYDLNTWNITYETK